MGHQATALKMFDDLSEEEQKSFDLLIAKAQILIKIGNPAEAIKVLDNTVQDSA
jgi:predicted Zn-dependent protease